MLSIHSCNSTSAKANIIHTVKGKGESPGITGGISIRPPNDVPVRHGNASCSKEFIFIHLLILKMRRIGNTRK